MMLLRRELHIFFTHHANNPRFLKSSNKGIHGHLYLNLIRSLGGKEGCLLNITQDQIQYTVFMDLIQG
ncbi:hypothetical protein MRB53_030687 [Persea americana]|uniref:Uncharacterized protein n=1 Tax=Persea americana TaxID=3435 RepID=A0ACC2KMB1_PERAE|nr:hypothetical protein MRB53_030687 [Persea americana]